MAIDVQALTAKRADYVQGLSNVQAQAQAARQQLEQLVRQVAAQLAEYMRRIAVEKYYQDASADLREEAEANVHW